MKINRLEGIVVITILFLSSLVGWYAGDYVLENFEGRVSEPEDTIMIYLFCGYIAFMIIVFAGAFIEKFLK